MLDWSQPVLAERAHISQTTLRNFEKGYRSPTHNNLAAIKSALEAAGVEFIDENGGGPGVRLSRKVG